MCGIAGFVESHPSPAEPRARRVAEMCDAIRHRGPDDSGQYVDEVAALGMRRLSIIDLSTGHQPMANEDETLWVVFNGEIYNYQPLGRELRERGHRFRTASDTEVIVHAWEEWGQGALQRLHGMFAIAVWDTRSRTLWLARDRPGIKPLHYALSRRWHPLRLGDQVVAGRSGIPARDGPRRRSITTALSSTRQATDRSSRPSGSCLRHTCFAGATASRRSSATGSFRPARRSEARNRMRRTRCGRHWRRPSDRT